MILCCLTVLPYCLLLFLHTLGKINADDDDDMSDLVVGVLLAAPARTEVLDRHAQVSGSEVEQHLFGFVE